MTNQPKSAGRNRGNEPEFFRDGWRIVDHDPVLLDWIRLALPEARKAVRDPKNAEWLRHGGSWFVGVNALENFPDGSVGHAPPLNGQAVQFIRKNIIAQDFSWDQAQISVCYPGYPKQSDDEPETAHRYRVKRDAAHIDGLIRVGPNKRRHLMEYHGFILGIPMVEVGAGASPFVIWRGSHQLARERFEEIYQNHAPETWCNLDVTDAYQALRKEIFESCERCSFSLKPGQSFIVHRLALHGMAPWDQDAGAGPDGRMICYFRPEIGGPKEWLNRP